MVVEIISRSISAKVWDILNVIYKLLTIHDANIIKAAR